MCSYEVGLFNGTLATGLCSLFDVEDRRILDFWSDLKIIANNLRVMR